MLWLTSRMLRRSPPREGELAAAGFAGEKGLTAFGERPYEALPIYAVPGVSALPKEGEPVLILPLGEGEICRGVRSDTEGLLPGELRLCSCGGAEILLKQNGEILLNGLTITREGKLIPPERME